MLIAGWVLFAACWVGGMVYIFASHRRFMRQFGHRSASISWPWVRWATYFDECEGLRREMAQLVNRENSYVQTVERLTRTTLDLREDLKEARDYNRTLVQTIVDLKREGHATPAAPPTMQPRPRDPVSDAISVVAGNSIAERSRIGRYVSLLRTRKMTDDEIVHELLNPQPDEEGVS